MWKIIYGLALAGSMSIIGVHSCSDRTLAPVVQITHVQVAPCEPKKEIAPAHAKKKSAHFTKKKNAKKKFSGTHRHRHKTTHHHHHHTSSHGHAPAKTFPSHAPPTHTGLTGPPCPA